MISSIDDLINNIEDAARILKDQDRRLNKIVALVGGLKQVIEAKDKVKIGHFLDEISKLAAGETSE